VGRDPSDAEVSCFDRWIEIMEVSYDAIRPGATLGDVGRAATAANGGDSPWLPHFYLAHGVGLESAEMPMIGTDLGEEFDDTFVLAPGMILVLEPVVWDDGIASYRSEEIVTVTHDGCRILSGMPGYTPFTP
jgi:Xaa-Pro aminopeptidase